MNKCWKNGVFLLEASKSRFESKRIEKNGFGVSEGTRLVQDVSYVHSLFFQGRMELVSCSCLLGVILACGFCTDFFPKNQQ
jgi:hypothetical protein